MSILNTATLFDIHGATCMKEEDQPTCQSKINHHRSSVRTEGRMTT